jgi:hypothetical protein
MLATYGERMPPINETFTAAFGTAEFWYCYLYQDSRVDWADVGAQLTERAEADDSGTSVVELPTTAPWRLRLDLSGFDVETVLELSDARNGSSAGETGLPLGTWNPICWHPWALRWDEVEAVLARMRAEPAGQHVSPDLALLLLAPFVGHGHDEADLLADRRSIVAVTLDRLELFTADEADRMAGRFLSRMPQDDYAWHRCAEHGWEFLSQQDQDYSDRHPSGEFPFAAMAEFRRALGLD